MDYQKELNKSIRDLLETSLVLVNSPRITDDYLKKSLKNNMKEILHLSDGIRYTP